jgi:NADPH:quinone reductase-like Zn-dependent oxidoreductase
MKAIVCIKYGPPDVLELKEIEKPNTKGNEVLIKVHTSTVTPMDWHFPQLGKNFIARMIAGLIKARSNILGVELAGEVEAVGKDVKLFKQGDQVYGGGRPGSHAECVYPKTKWV